MLILFKRFQIKQSPYRMLYTNTNRIIIFFKSVLEDKSAYKHKLEFLSKAKSYL